MALAIVTGAVGGMGAPIARLFAHAGYDLILCDMNLQALEALSNEIAEDLCEIDLVPGDISGSAFIPSLMEAIGDREVDACIHTAGLSPNMADGPRIFEVNYFATDRLVAAVSPRMSQGSCIVLISSSSAYMVKPEAVDVAIDALVNRREPALALGLAATPQSAYPLSKRAIIALVAREAVTLGPRGVRIASIAPGFIDTGMGRLELDANERKVAMVAKTPLGRMGEGTEIASVAFFLCSPEASYISGCDIKVDGGALAALGY